MDIKGRSALIVMLVMFLAGCNFMEVKPPPNKSQALTEAAVTQIVGDLGWGEVRGRVTSTITGAPVAGVHVTCEQDSYHPLSLCSGAVTTAADGSYLFPHVFFHDTDRIYLWAEAPGYETQSFRQDFFTQPVLIANISLPPAGPTPVICCTAPACSDNEVYFCAGECPCGCGTTCATKTFTPFQLTPKTSVPSITPTPASFACIDCANASNALLYFCPLASGDEVARQQLNPYGEIQQGMIGGHTCLYVNTNDGYQGYVYYVESATSLVRYVIINLSLMPPTETPTP